MSDVDDDPMGPDYWAAFDAEAEQVDGDRERRDGLYGGCDPATGGWSRSLPANPRAGCVTPQN